MKLIQLLVTLAISVLTAVFTAKISTSRWEGSFLKFSIVGSILSALATFGSVLFDGLGMSNVQTILLCCVFLYISYSDIKTHEADDFLHVIVLAVALIAKPAEQIPEALLSAVILGGLMLVVGTFIPGAGIEGADVKFTAACALLTNLESGLFGLGLGAFIALIFNPPFGKKGKARENERIPMLPYLSCSYMLIHLLA